MPSDLRQVVCCCTLVASKPAGSFLELGTGTGLSLSWIVEGMDNDASVISIDNNETYLAIARKFLITTSDVTIVCEDGNAWIRSNPYKQFDLVLQMRRR